MTEVITETPGAENNNSETEVALRHEAANYRTQRNAALKEAKALRTIVEKHNIKLPDLENGMKDMTIKNGVVVGDFAYEAPKPKAPTQNAPVADIESVNPEFNDETLKNMSLDDINKNWDKISQVLKSKRK